MYFKKLYSHIGICYWFYEVLHFKFSAIFTFLIEYYPFFYVGNLQVVVKGWIRTARKGNDSFVELTDGSTVKGIQLVLSAATIGKDAVVGATFIF